MDRLREVYDESVAAYALINANQDVTMSLSRFRSRNTQLSNLSPSTLSIRRPSTAHVEELTLDERGSLGLNLLHNPVKPIAVFIFVHGLGGGSRKTWSKTRSTFHYWPQEWLPTDALLSQVQILSFGYDSDWAKGQDNVLNVHHFGKALLADMSTSPHLQSDPLPIVLIGHSMGGCVIKKTYILARQDVTLRPLADKIHAMFFLATPHRGADLAKALSVVLEAKSSSRAYVNDLRRCSQALQTINDEFRSYASDLRLWSFYETQKLQMGMFSALVVTVDSATLGYPEERQIPMTADHRSICKFDGPEDPNYLILRNSLTTVAREVLDAAALKNEETARSQLNVLQEYLAVKSSPEDDLITVSDIQLSGTCEWLSDRKGFQNWRDFRPGSPSILWINGKPGAGKSVLAGHVINRLEFSNAMCSYYFFKHGDKSKSHLSACLRSLALQMARHSDKIRSALLRMQNDEEQFDKENERMIWKKIFLNVILQQKLDRQYWVIDAVDECNHASILFDSILPDLNESIPIQILITSRESVEVAGFCSALGERRVQPEPITIDDTDADIKLLIQIKEKHLVFIKDDDRTTLMSKVMDKASGSLLWTVLVMNELANAHSKEEVLKILEEVPREMEPLYARALHQMAQFTRTKNLAKSILAWATCAIRPLTVAELREALELEIKDSFPRLGDSVTTLCCQLVVVDRFGKIQMIHETARRFLLDPELQSEFAVRKADAHTTLARTCLKYLTGDELKPPRGSRRGSAPSTTKRRKEFSNYACVMFAEHLTRADPGANDILNLMNRFLTSNVLSWIEVIAEVRDLDLLVRTSNRLKAYCNAVAAGRSPLCPQVSNIRSWAIDCVRIAAKFGDALIRCPWAVHSLISPFCPSTSMISKITVSGRRLSVVGSSSEQWDDRLSSISFQDQLSTVSHGDKFFAIGLNEGSIVVYHAGSCQEYRTLHHGEAVRFICFKPKTDTMASCGLKTVKVWDVHVGVLLYSFKAPPGPIGMVFDSDVLMVASLKKYLALWNLESPTNEAPVRPWRDSYEQQSGSGLVPCALSISVGHKMLAIGYAKGPITLWDIEANEFYSACCAQMANSEMNVNRVMALVLNPNPQIELLAVSYLDGSLVLFNPFQDQVLETFRANCFTLVSSNDGQLLAAGAGNGLVQIYAFESLRMLYQVQTHNSYIKQLAFSKDSLRLTDIRGNQCNIWEPPVLLREAATDSSSEMTSDSILEGTASDTTVKITAVCVHPEGKDIFCGKDDGSVSVYSLATGAYQTTLYKHKSRIRLITIWEKHAMLLSVDISNVVSAWQIKATDISIANSSTPGLIFQSRVDCEGSISQVLAGETSGKFIISSRHADYLHTVAGEREQALMSSEQNGSRRWVQDPRNSSHVLRIDERTIEVYSWNDWTKLACFPLPGSLTGVQLRAVRSYPFNKQNAILLELTQLDNPARSSHLQLFNLAVADIQQLSATSRSPGNSKDNTSLQSPILLHPEFLRSLASIVHHVVGLSRNGRLLFLDIHSWVCSVALHVADSVPTSYFRHFFVPRDWFSGMSGIICDLWHDSVVFTHNNDAVVIKGVSQHYEVVNFQ